MALLDDIRRRNPRVAELLSRSSTKAGRRCALQNLASEERLAPVADPIAAALGRARSGVEAWRALDATAETGDHATLGGPAMTGASRLFRLMRLAHFVRDHLLGLAAERRLGSRPSRRPGSVSGGRSRSVPGIRSLA